MNKHNKLLCMVFFAMMVAVGVVISPILRVEGMCPMAHLINITMAVFMGPWYAFLCALAIGLIRMMTMGIPPLALTGVQHCLAFSINFLKVRSGLQYLEKSLEQVLLDPLFLIQL